MCRVGGRRRYARVQQLLERVDSSVWRQLVFSVCFLHCIALERRKFSSLGWCQSYDFNSGDLSASLAFLEKHLLASGDEVSWQAVQYVVAEVQYGGRITDTMDRRLFALYTSKWLSPEALDAARFVYNPTMDRDAASARDVYKYSVRAAPRAVLSRFPPVLCLRWLPRHRCGSWCPVDVPLTCRGAMCPRAEAHNCSPCRRSNRGRRFHSFSGTLRRSPTSTRRRCLACTATRT
jgi:hypothetical protein